MPGDGSFQILASLHDTAVPATSTGKPSRSATPALSGIVPDSPALRIAESRSLRFDNVGSMPEFSDGLQ